jgi:hypothetical protein
MKIKDFIQEKEIIDELEKEQQEGLKRIVKMSLKNIASTEKILKKLKKHHAEMMDKDVDDLLDEVEIEDMEY